MNQKLSLTFEIDCDPNALRSITDQYLAQLWHIAQANPAPSSDPDAADFVSSVGTEIIRRWMSGVEVELYAHQPNDFMWSLLRQHGKFSDSGRDWTPDLPEAEV